MSSERTIRVLLAKPGLDGHDVGMKVVASALRDAGMEVVYTGLRQTPEEIVKAAIAEDADLIGLSFHSLAHKVITPKVINLLKENNASHILVIVGGSILKKDADAMKKMGVTEVFGPESATSDIVDFVKKNVRRQT
jgi:methylmalonyl-CoA mutase C-terminal domain/subunit